MDLASFSYKMSLNPSEVRIRKREKYILFESSNIDKGSHQTDSLGRRLNAMSIKNTDPSAWYNFEYIWGIINSGVSPTCKSHIKKNKLHGILACSNSNFFVDNLYTKFVFVIMVPPLIIGVTIIKKEEGIVHNSSNWKSNTKKALRYRVGASRWAHSWKKRLNISLPWPLKYCKFSFSATADL